MTKSGHQFSVKTEKEFNAHAQTTTKDNLEQQFLGKKEPLSLLSCFFRRQRTEADNFFHKIMTVYFFIIFA